MIDPINAPEHYTFGEIECIDAIRAQMNKDEYQGYLRGNVVKYLWRFRSKGGIESLKKAQWYLAKLVESELQARISPLADTPGVLPFSR
jgi:hypothetical protein